MRRPLFFSAVLSIALTASINARAQNNDGVPYGARGVVRPSNTSLQAPDDFIDRMAADFFEDSMRPSQAKRVEAATAQTYRNMSPADQAKFRSERLEFWLSLSDEQRNSLRGVKTPNYLNLTETQKKQFRSIAAGKLGAASPAGAPGTNI